jgi:chemotaxis protein CheZ
MARVEPVVEYSAERQLRQRQFGPREVAGGTEILAAIDELRREIAELRDRGGSGIGMEMEAEHQGAVAARIEIAQMVRMIGRAKMEIAAIKHPMADDDRMLNAAGELDAIVVATETSTQDVLAASEEIENLTRKIANACHDDEEVVGMTDRIANEIIKIFEACNFQDITGQRINKVIKTLRFIEERILSMIEIWGTEAFAELPVPETGHAAQTDGDDGLMNGPQREGGGITQDEINALFD